MPTKRRSLILSAVAIPSIVGAHLAWSQVDPDASERSLAAQAATTLLLPVSPLRIERVEEYSRARAYTGELEARRATELGFNASGLLLEVLCEEGDSIEAGAPLARIDRARLEASIAGAVARRAQAEALLAELRGGPRAEVVAIARAVLAEIEEELELARARLARRQSLVETNAIAREAVEEAERGVDVMESRLEARTSALEELLSGTREERIDAQEAVARSLDAEVAALEVEIGKSTLIAPFAGTIAHRHLDEGAVVSAGQPVVRLVESSVLEDPKVVDAHWFADESAPKFYYNQIEGKRGSPNYASAIVQLSDAEALAAWMRRTQRRLDELLPAVRVLIRLLEQGPPADAQVEVLLEGSDLDALTRAGDELRRELAASKGVLHTLAGLRGVQPQLGLVLDENEVQLGGLTRSAVADQLEAALEGVVGGSLIEGTEELPVRVRFSGETRADLDRLASMQVVLPARGEHA